MANVQNISHLVSVSATDFDRGGAQTRAADGEPAGADRVMAMDVVGDGRSPDERQGQGASLESAVVRLQDYAERHHRALEFSVDEATGRSVIRVVDPQTEKVIREIPPEEVLALARYLHEQSDEAGGALLRTEA